ncbi:MAG: GNAT family N-acetyltransferase [Pseudomonadota bacterium]
MAVTWTDEATGLDWDEVAELYRLAPLVERSPEMLKQVFSNSMFKSFAFDEGRLVAAGRVLADGADCAYLCDIAVLPSHQGRGLGGDLIRGLVEKSKGHDKVLLYAVPGKEPLYEKFGFRRMTTAMVIFEDPDKAFSDGYLASK